MRQDAVRDGADDVDEDDENGYNNAVADTARISRCLVRSSTIAGGRVLSSRLHRRTTRSAESLERYSDSFYLRSGNVYRVSLPKRARRDIVNQNQMRQIKGEGRGSDDFNNDFGHVSLATLYREQKISCWKECRKLELNEAIKRG